MRLRSLEFVIAAAALSIAVPATAVSMGPEPPAASAPKQTAPKQDNTKSSNPQQDQKKNKKDAKKEKQSQLLWDQGFGVAYELVYNKHDYAAGIDQLKSLHQDNHPDVANLLGYASRKLGRYDDSKYWYERALASDPRHARTWSYYGMWHAEQGNLLKAQEFLTKVASICGTGCREYTELKGVIEGTRTY